MKNIYLSLAAVMLACACAHGQGTLSGDLQANVNFFQRDSTIGTAPIPPYESNLSGGESWLSLRYSAESFSAFLRIDAFHNSNLYDPTSGSLTAYGIGAFSVTKDIGDLTLTGGYIYDQIGSGILFRTYEDRGLLIDNALVGLQVRYRPTSNINIKAFTGQIKQITPDVLFNRYKPIIKGFNAEGDFGQKVHFTPGIGIINRTLDGNSRSTTVASATAEAALNGDTGRMYIPYNMYAGSIYNTLTVGDFSWYVEGAIKSQEAIKDFTDNVQSVSGNVLYSTLSYARKGVSVNLTGKRTENFVLRTSANEELWRGILNWQPIVGRLRPQRLMARYTPASQNLSELAFSADVLVAPTENVDITLNYAHINTLEDVKLYREIYAEVEYREFKNWIIHAGVQLMEYNQQLYQTKVGKTPVLRAATPFTEITHRFNDKHSLRIDAQYMFTKEGEGSWAFLLAEYNISPHWSFAVSDMYLTKVSAESDFKDNKHFYQFFTAYTKGPHRLTLAYAKQVEGFNCSGGVCRYEPAFSGVRLGINTTF